MNETKLAKAIRGSGGGGSGEQEPARQPVTAPDSVQSKALLSILDLICEGQVKGLVNGAEGILLDGVPLLNPDSTPNFNGFSWQFRDGKQDQEVITGFPDVSTPYNLGTRIKNNAPVTFAVSNNDADAVRVIITIPSLTNTNEETGDVNGATVQYQFQMSVNGAPFTVINVAGTDSGIVTIKDKSRSRYQREHLISLPKPGSNYRIRVLRVTADTTSAYITDETYLDSYYEIIDVRLTYPNSVMLGVTVNAEQFSSLPGRAYLIDGMYIRIPSNYDPETRSYAGVWDGSFKIGFSNNPAWVLYDLLLNRRYGLGEFIKPSNINRAKLYQIGRYCDGMVTDGRSGMEPRFTINTSIAAQNDAYRIISDICSVFRGMSYWSGGMVQVIQDAPSDPVFLFNNSNVIDGMFNRSGSARKDRHSVVHVQWNDPSDSYKQKIEYVEDADLIKSVGYRRMDTIAFGCTSRAQAHRVGLWILYTEKVETNIITFGVGLDGLQCMPGDIVKIQDQYKAGKRNGGRLRAATRVGCTLDAATDVPAGAIIAIQMPNGNFEERVVNQVGSQTNLTFASQLSAVPKPNAVWIMTQPNLVPVLARCVGVAQGEKPGQFVMSVVEHNPSKYGSIEQNLQLDIIPTTILDPTFSTPESMIINETTYLQAPGVIGSRLDVSWIGKSPEYIMSWRRTIPNGSVSTWTTVTLKKALFELPVESDNSTYDFSLVARSVTGKLTEPLVGTYKVLGTMNPPKAPSNLTAIGDFRCIILKWTPPDSLDLSGFEVWENTIDDVNTATRIAKPGSADYIRQGLPGLAKRYYWVKAVNKRGMASPFNSNIGVSAVTVQATHEDVVKQFVDSSLLAPTLEAGLKSYDAALESLVGFVAKVAEQQSTIDRQANKIAAIEEFVSTVTSGEGQYATKEELLIAKNESTQAVIDHVDAVFAGPNGSLAAMITSLEARMNDKIVGLEITAEVLDGLKSQYTVKIDNNGYIAGFGLASDASSGVPISEFLVLADRFAIAQPNQGEGSTYPFIVTTVNGKSQISMNSAFITEIVAAVMKSPDNKFRIDLANKLISIEV